tara:strand:- start:1687 stop:2127 length:441 start_codon:yes stop_codon:yes gene_type:complete
MKLTKNKVKTAGYVIKRLRDNGFIVIKCFAFFAKQDPRLWTVLINPGEASVFLTCFLNKEKIDEVMFELNDGGRFFPRNVFLKTDSIEVLVQYLLEHNVTNSGYYPGKRFFIKGAGVLNINNEITQQKTDQKEETLSGESPLCESC